MFGHCFLRLLGCKNESLGRKPVSGGTEAGKEKVSVRGCGAGGSALNVSQRQGNTHRLLSAAAHGGQNQPARKQEVQDSE